MVIFLKNKIIPLIFTCLIFSGCGYSTHAVLTSGEASVYVDNFKNKIDVTSEISDEKIYYAYTPGAEANITRLIIDRFIADGTYEIKEEKDAQFLLVGSLIDFRREPLRYDTNDNVTEYRISIAVDIELFDSVTGELVWEEKTFAGEATYRTSGQYSKSESTATEEAIEDLARRIVERTVENW